MKVCFLACSSSELSSSSELPSSSKSLQYMMPMGSNPSLHVKQHKTVKSVHVPGKKHLHVSYRLARRRVYSSDWVRLCAMMFAIITRTVGVRPRPKVLFLT